jgi:hypothetical protein
MPLFQSITVIFSAGDATPEGGHASRAPHGPTSGPSTNDGPGEPLGEPIYFYDSDKPYYESENLPLLLFGSFIPILQVHQLFRPLGGIPWPRLPNSRAL